MTDELKELRRELGRGGRGRGKRYSAEIRERVVVWAAQRRKDGVTWPMVAQELGLGLDTVRRWCLVRQPRDKSRRGVVPVRVVGGGETRPAQQVSVTGWRIDGLTVADAAALLRALG